MDAEITVVAITAEDGIAVAVEAAETDAAMAVVGTDADDAAMAAVGITGALEIPADGAIPVAGTETPEKHSGMDSVRGMRPDSTMDSGKAGKMTTNREDQVRDRAEDLASRESLVILTADAAKSKRRHWHLPGIQYNANVSTVLCI